MATFDNDLFNFAVQLSRDTAQRYQNMTDAEFEEERVRERAEQVTEPDDPSNCISCGHGPGFHRSAQCSFIDDDPRQRYCLCEGFKTREEIEADLERGNREWHEANNETIRRYDPAEEADPKDNQNFD